MTTDSRAARYGTMISDDAALGGLLSAAQDGDRAAYRAFLTAISLRLRRRIGQQAPWLNIVDVEDIVQDTLISVHHARATWDASRPVLPWLAAIARARLADHGRRQGRQAAISLAALTLTETFCPSATNTHADSVVDYLSVRRAMQQLTPAERKAFEMIRLRELTLEQAATETGSTVASLKVAVHRAGLKLRRILDGVALK